MKKDRVLPLIAIVVSVVAIGIALYRSFHLDWDAIMFSVAMLSGLVVLLIGWQIFTLIDIRKIHEDVSLKRNQTYWESEKNLGITFIGLSDYFYYSLRGGDIEGERLYKYIYYRISSILHISKISDFETCAAVVKALKETIRPEYISLRAPEKKTLFDLLSGVENVQSIEGFSDLLELISRIETKD